MLYTSQRSVPLSNQIIGGGAGILLTGITILSQDQHLIVNRNTDLGDVIPGRGGYMIDTLGILHMSPWGV